MGIGLRIFVQGHWDLGANTKSQLLIQVFSGN